MRLGFLELLRNLCIIINNRYKITILGDKNHIILELERLSCPT